MLRKIVALGLLLILVTSGYSIAAKPDGESDSKQSSNSKGRTESNSKPTRGPYYCLQQLWLDYPGDEDLYVSMTYDEDCEHPPREEFWYGTQHIDMPQDCDNCESSYGTEMRGNLQPHGLKLNDVKAWKMVQAGLEAAGISSSGVPHRFHKIPKSKMQEIGIERAVYLIAVPMKPVGKIDGTRYLCVETDPLPDSALEPATTNFDIPGIGPGAQLRVSYKVGSEARKGFVWLKDSDDRAKNQGARNRGEPLRTPRKPTEAE